jgi:murein DD-endopeptidase MepM/ murein hydrolase activator NlpD
MRIAAPPPTALVGLLFLSCLGGGPVSASQSKPQSPPPSSKIVAFDNDAADPADSADSARPATTTPPTASDKPDPRRAIEPGKTRTIYYGRVIPTPPNVSIREAARTRNDRARTPVFTSRPAAATALAVNSHYGVRYDPLTGAARMHTGVDLRANYGDAVGASMSGMVLFAGSKGGYGNCVIIDHGSGISTYYAHLSAITVAVGQSVEAGEYIGQVGSTGRSTGPHLHYEVRANGHPLEPKTHITIDEGALFAAGRLVSDPVDPLSDAALPLAPGGTTIAVTWGPADKTKTSEHALAIEFE